MSSSANYLLYHWVHRRLPLSDPAISALTNDRLHENLSQPFLFSDSSHLTVSSLPRLIHSLLWTRTTQQPATVDTANPHAHETWNVNGRIEYSSRLSFVDGWLAWPFEAYSRFAHRLFDVRSLSSIREGTCLEIVYLSGWDKRSCEIVYGRWVDDVDH